MNECPGTCGGGRYDTFRPFTNLWRDIAIGNHVLHTGNFPYGLSASCSKSQVSQSLPAWRSSWGPSDDDADDGDDDEDEEEDDDSDDDVQPSDRGLGAGRRNCIVI